MPYVILERLTATIKFLKNTIPVIMILQKNKQMLILVLDQTLFLLQTVISNVEITIIQGKVI